MNKEQKPDQAEKTLTAEDVDRLKLKTLQALRNEPSRYKIDVIDGDMLPDKLKGRKQIEFLIKPPTIHTLSKLAEIVIQIPGEVMAAKGMSAEVLRHLPKVVEMLAILSHGSSTKPMPDWYVPFLERNLTTQEVLMLWQETTMKLDTSFFLPFIQASKAGNPLMMMSQEEMQEMIDSIHSK